MTTKLIRLDDSTLIEVEVSEEEVQQISGRLANKVDTTLSNMRPILLKACQPIVAAVKDLPEVTDLERVEVEIGLGFDVEGNIYITKAGFGANVLVRMRLRRRE